jgi:ATP-dependent Clp endopeptidase proteolytic subunit ClpP
VPNLSLPDDPFDPSQWWPQDLDSLGEVPGDPEELAEWNNAVRARFAGPMAAMELVATSVRLRQMHLETAKMEDERVEAMSRADSGRVYLFSDEVGEDSVRRALETLDRWHRRNPGAPIEIILNSPGGRVTEGLALFDYLRWLSGQGHHITTVALGRAASMGSVLLQAGDTRVVGRNSMIMLHEVSAGAIGTVQRVQDQVEHMNRVQEQLIALLCDRSKLTPAKLRKRWVHHDWWLSATEALELGLVDEIR